MSQVHIRLMRTRQDIEGNEYVVESPDFSKSSEWQVVGKLVFSKKAGRYEFKPTTVWSKGRALPPEIYAFEEVERESLIASKYRGFGWGAWAMMIHGYASQFLKTGNYPDKYPPIFFS